MRCKAQRLYEAKEQNGGNYGGNKIFKVHSVENWDNDRSYTVFSLCRHCADTGSGYGLSVKHICFQELYDK